MSRNATPVPATSCTSTSTTLFVMQQFHLHDELDHARDRRQPSVPADLADHGVESVPQILCALLADIARGVERVDLCLQLGNALERQSLMITHPRGPLDPARDSADRCA